MEIPNNKYDVIIIGSGMSALSSASILSQMYKKKVLILEQHGKIGGFTHSFKRKVKYEWDVGLHYVGGMRKGEMGRAAFDFITQGRLKWQNPEKALRKNRNGTLRNQCCLRPDCKEGRVHWF